MKIISRYIWSYLLLFIGSIFFVFLSLNLLIVFIGKLTDSSKTLSLLDIVLFSIYVMPSDLSDFFPIIVFLGVLLGLGKMSQLSELVVIRSSGYSRYRIIGSVFVIGVLCMIGMFVIGEVVAPFTKDQSIKIENKENDGGLYEGGSYWVQQGGITVHIKNITAKENLHDIVIYYQKDYELYEIAEAEFGYYISGQWILKDVKRTLIKPHGGVDYAYREHMRLPVSFDLRYNLKIGKFSFRNTSRDQTLWGLYKMIKYRQASGIPTDLYQYIFWSRIFRPITLLLMSVLAVPFILSANREVTTGSRVMLGAILGFIYYMLNELFAPITMIYDVPIILAAATPSLLFFVFFIYMLIRKK